MLAQSTRLMLVAVVKGTVQVVCEFAQSLGRITGNIVLNYNLVFWSGSAVGQLHLVGILEIKQIL